MKTLRLRLLNRFISFHLLFLVGGTVSAALKANCSKSFGSLSEQQSVLSKGLGERAVSYFDENGFINSESFRWSLIKAYEQYGTDNLFENALNDFEKFPLSKGTDPMKNEKMERQIQELKKNRNLKMVVSMCFERLFSKHQKYYADEFNKINEGHSPKYSLLMGSIGVPFVVGPILQMFFDPSVHLPTDFGPLGPLVVGGALWIWNWGHDYKQNFRDTGKRLREMNALVLDEGAYQRLMEMDRVSDH